MNAPAQRAAEYARLQVSGEYLGSDREGNEYYTRGGHVYTVGAARSAVCGRGRFSAFNRLRRRHPGAIAAA